MNRISRLKEQNGASIVVAILLLLVVTISCTSLFYVISTTVSNAGQGKDREQAMILAQSLSEAVQKEIKDNKPNEMNGNNLQEGTISNYLFDNIGSSWSYYNPDIFMNSNKESATKRFPLKEDIFITEGVNESLSMTAEISMYWTSDSATETEKNYAGDVRALYITSTVTVKGNSGNQSASVTAVFYYRPISSDSDIYWWDYQESM